MAGTFPLTLRSAMPGGSWARIWRDTNGRPMIKDRYDAPLKCSVIIDPEIPEIQPDSFNAPVKHLKLHVSLEGTKPYDVLVPLTRINGSRSDFVTTMETKVLPEGTKCTEALRDAMIAASFAPEVWQVHDQEFGSTDKGLFANGKRLCNVKFTICGETRNAYGERAYILRKENGERVTVDAREMPLGRYAYQLGGDATIYDGVELWLHLSREWAARTEQEKAAFDLEPIRKKQAEIAAKLREEEQRARWRLR